MAVSSQELDKIKFAGLSSVSILLFLAQDLEALYTNNGIIQHTSNPINIIKLYIVFSDNYSYTRAQSVTHRWCHEGLWTLDEKYSYNKLFYICWEQCGSVLGPWIGQSAGGCIFIWPIIVTSCLLHWQVHIVFSFFTNITTCILCVLSSSLTYTAKKN